MHHSTRTLLLIGAVTATLLAGCNRPVRTAGTEKLPPEQLALVRVLQHGGLTAWRGQPIHVATFFVGNAEYPIDKDTDFLLTPGTHKLAVDYAPCLHGVDQSTAAFDDSTGVFAGPFGRFEATVEPGVAYTITADPTLVARNAVQTRHGLRVVPRAK